MKAPTSSPASLLSKVTSFPFHTEKDGRDEKIYPGNQVGQTQIEKYSLKSTCGSLEEHRNNVAKQRRVAKWFPNKVKTLYNEPVSLCSASWLLCQVPLS